MAKARTTFVCQNCGAIAPRWQGRCDACGEWNTLVEEGTAIGIGAQAARSPRNSGRRRWCGL
jgi:DNA repair protein RadA/Sms